MTAARLSLSAYIAQNDARLDRMEAMLVTLVSVQSPEVVAPTARQITRGEARARKIGAEANAKARVRKEAKMVQPTGPLFPAGSCQGCGKEGMISNTLCRKCRMVGTVEVRQGQHTTSRRLNSTPAQVAAAIRPTAKAKGNQNGHCDAPSCGKFLNRMGECALHG